jgi:hypothetical protein
MDFIELSCGALSIKTRNPLCIREGFISSESRIYLTYEEMIKAEASLPA